MIVVVIFQVGIALVLALFVDSIKRGKKLYRLLFFFPVVISGTAIGLMFRLSYEYQYGLLNTIGAFFGMPKRVWLDSGTSLIACIIPTAWQYVGFYFVIFLTAMSKVPEDIYESAILDGIDGIKKARYITIPLIWDTVATSIALVVAGTLKAFDIFFIITKGGPMNSSELLSTYMYTKVFSGQNNGYGCAIAVLIIILGFGLTMISNKLTERESVMM
jgi:raffinose/stachyose/melibiose transport system permease protein